MVNRENEGDQVAGMPDAFGDGCLEDAQNDGKDEEGSREEEREGEEVESLEKGVSFCCCAYILHICGWSEKLCFFFLKDGAY